MLAREADLLSEGGRMKEAGSSARETVSNDLRAARNAKTLAWRPAGGEQWKREEHDGAAVPVTLIYLGVDWRSLRRTGPTVNKSWD